MLRWAPGFFIAAVIGVLVGLLEALVAATGLEKMVLLLFLALFWLTSFSTNREEKGERSNEQRVFLPSGK